MVMETEPQSHDELPPAPRATPFGAPEPVAPAYGLSRGAARFARVWLALDASPLRAVWPVALGAAVAGLALWLSGSVPVALMSTVVVVGLIAWMGRTVTRHLEELDRLSD